MGSFIIHLFIQKVRKFHKRGYRTGNGVIAEARLLIVGGGASVEETTRKVVDKF